MTKDMANGMANGGFATGFDKADTLTDGRTYVTDADQDSGLNIAVPNPPNPVEEIDSLRLDGALDGAFEAMDATNTRGAVRNREPRPDPVDNRHVWSAVMRRDGGSCWMCGTRAGMIVLDHLVPRSSFTPAFMHLADRTDNLRVACWDCNQVKSNRLIPFSKPLPIVAMCVEEFGGIDAVVRIFTGPLMPAFCARHGMTELVPASYPFWGLE